jgi:beta-N-acetylhexosaminidase
LPLIQSPTSKVFNLAITNGEDRLYISQAFVGAMTRAGIKMETVVLDDRSSDAEVQKAADRAASADVVVISMYGRVRSGQINSGVLPKPGARALSALLARRVSLIGISFGNPYLLMSFPALPTYLVAYGDMPSLQKAAADAITGRINVRGRLPISLPGLYSRGAGIQLTAASNR